MELDIENVQKIKKLNIRFEEPGLSLIYGDNAIGKSSIIKAIAASISYDTSNRDKRIIEEEKVIGILPDDTRSNFGLIRVGENEAKIQIKSTMINKNVIISRNGNFRGSDPKFLITNIISDVSWMMRVLTHTTFEKINNYLEGFNNMIPRYDDIIDNVEENKKYLFQKIQELNRMIKESYEAQENIKEDKNLLEVANERLNALQEKITEEAKKDPNKEAKISEMNKQIYEIDKKIRVSAATIEKREIIIRDYKMSVEDQTKNINQFKNQLEETSKIINSYDLSEIEDIPKMEEEINLLKTQRSKEQILYDILKRTQSMLEDENSKEVICPLCGSSKINIKEIETISQEKDSAIRDFDSRISILSRKVGELNEKSKRNKNLSQQITNLEASITTKLYDLSNVKKDLDDATKELEEEESKKNELIQRKNKIQLALSGNSEDDKVMVKSLQDQIGKLSKEIKDLEMSKKYSQINIFEKNYPVETKTLDIFDKAVMTSLSDIEKHFKELREKERTKLKEEFNKSIKGILKEMSFDLDIFLDNDFNILARKQTDEGYRRLETKSLSRSEQATIGLTLQLALASSYSSEIPIILCDGIYEYFDEERRKKVLSFINKFAQKQNKIIIMTVVKEGIKSPMVSSYEM